MILKIRFGKFRLTITLAPVIDVIGVNSLLPDGNHILMWDFDDVELEDVLIQLTYVQLQFGLPNIYVLNTGKLNSYIAYSFKSVTWFDAKRIIAATRYVCENFYKWGVFRGRFTLRVSPKGTRRPRLVEVLTSPVRETAFIEQLFSWVMYETLPDGPFGPIIKLGEK